MGATRSSSQEDVGDSNDELDNGGNYDDDDSGDEQYYETSARPPLIPPDFSSIIEAVELFTSQFSNRYCNNIANIYIINFKHKNV